MKPAALEPAPLDVDAVRARFPGLSLEVAGRPAAFLDGPAGSQTPDVVLDAIRDYLISANANHGGLFATSRRNDQRLEQARVAARDFFNAPDVREIVFGANMTSLTFALSRAIAREWKAGDEILLSRLDHDANVTPWALAARDAGVLVRHVEIRPEDCTLDLADFERKLSPRTRLVAVGCASNAVGTRNPIEAIVARAKEVGAMVFLDAVHFAPHALPDVAAWGCDFAVCSAYKFFGPHVGMLWGRRELLERLPAYKVRPASDLIPDRWMTGTPNFEGIAGAAAAIDYLASLADPADRGLERRPRLRAAFERIARHETALLVRLLDGLESMPNLQIFGVRDRARLAERVPTVAIRVKDRASAEVARFLGERGVFVWHGNFYALPLTEALGVEPDGLVRIGLLHYNTAQEVDRLLEALREMG